MASLQNPENFNMKDLYINVNLSTCVNTTEYDFTGRKTFNTKFYREDIGFGITDIGIDINTSLQPSIDITFKDLYGNTLFGTQRGMNNSIDSSVLFNWPPPKFILTFKGYLGRSVTWLLNLKSTNVSYKPSDSSYEIRCSFVPNQWGFLADLPALYLLACKKLRYESYGNKEYEKISNNCIFETDGIFSFIKTGKRVETKTKEETKNFDLLLKQMGSIRYSINSAVCGAEIIKIDEPIKGIINGIEIKGFTNIEITSPNKSLDDLKNEYKNSSNYKKIEQYLQLNVKIGKIGDPQDENFLNIAKKIEFDSFKSNGEVEGINSNDVDKYKNNLFNIIDENIRLINDEIKRRVFSSSKSQLSKLTIGEVFRELARDGGFILGSILQAGFKGYENNKSKRDNEGQKELIGKCFPLYISDKGEEIPAMTPLDIKKYGNGPDVDYGVKDEEMAFVDKFIKAIGEGIANNLISDDVASNDDDIIKKRINNLEGIRPNPYKPFYSNIAENILIRSGIIAYITRSSDPSRPGDYPNDEGTDDDSTDAIVSLANSDMENLTKDILSQMSFQDIESLKKFCVFFDRFISDDNDEMDTKIGEYMLYVSDENPDVVLKSNFNLKLCKPFGEPVSDKIRTAKVNVGELSPSNRNYWANSEVGKNKIFLTINDIINDLIPPTKNATSNNVLNEAPLYYSDIQNTMFYTPADDKPAFYNASLIDSQTLTSNIVINNGLYWSLPKPHKDKYVFVLFDNASDASKTKDIMVQDSTSQEDLDGEEDPIGYIAIDTWNNSKKESESNPALDSINPRIEDGNCINYSSCKSFFNDTDKYLQTRKIQSQQIKQPEEIAAKNLSFSIYTHITDEDRASDESTSLVFGPFLKSTSFDDGRSKNQRAAIKTMCKAVLKKFDEIETEKSQAIANVYGKANEAREAIYKQMHTIFHQWQVIASSVAGKKRCENFNSGDLKEDLAKVLEREYGNCENHKERATIINGGFYNSKLKDLVSENSNTLFVYDYPLAPVNGEYVNVKNSIINIEPLYKPDGNTTVLNLIQQICTKNNFIFVPFPGDANSDDINEIYKPFPTYKGDDKIVNYFHVIFTPTPESRAKISNEKTEFLTDYMSPQGDFQNDAIAISFGAVDNQIVKSVDVGTDSTKPTAESILNLQRLVDKENSDHQVLMDCSMLPVYEGRSYKAKIDMIGNAQVYPMQYFYLKNMPMFGGLYLILKVNHSITPNDMSTSIEGIRMRFDANKKAYGGIPPITLDDLASLEGVSAPIQEIIKKSDVVSTNSSASVGDKDLSKDFIKFAKDFEIHTLSDMDNFVYLITKNKFSSFLQFFNSNQALVGEFKDNAILNDVGGIGSRNLVLFDYISDLSTKSNKSFNPLEIITLWETTLSESMGINNISEGGELNYFFGTLNGKKQSYNKSPNLTVSELVKNYYFKKRFSGVAYFNRNLFTNIESWCGGQDKMPEIYDTKVNSNIVYNCDFCKFRGRGYIQFTWRNSYKMLLNLLKTSDSQRVKSIINSWISIAGNNDSDALLNVSSTDEWDKLFSYPEVSSIAYKINLQLHSYGHKVDKGLVEIKLDNEYSQIKDKIISIGETPSWSNYKYGYNNYLRISQLCNNLVEIGK